MIKVAYTRTGKQFHAMEAKPGQRSGKTLCGKHGYVHPEFAEAPASLALGLNFGCIRCRGAIDR